MTNNQKIFIDTLENNARISTQELLEKIYQEMKQGTVEFEINASGQHNIGGCLWANDNLPLKFIVKNPGQRVGSMGMKNTYIEVIGSAPADVGWLNSGAEIVVKGDCGDTTAHCAASGKIFISGEVGTRSGALMKNDPSYSSPELWVLKKTGSFSFEFMGGGIAVICGYECENLPSVLGERSCIGMVGGIVYFRGKVSNLDKTVDTCELNEDDKKFLLNGMKEFLSKIDKPEIFDKLTDFSEWKKIAAKPYQTKSKTVAIKDFRENQWVEGGIFGCLIEDDLNVYNLIETGETKLKASSWQKEKNGKKCVNCDFCINNCPTNAIYKENDDFKIKADKCIGCGICKGVCPVNLWDIEYKII
ncbi:MAG: 4Fe-4S binding protein [Candidatus Gastranaerophilales bacterium]|nr:4Fe-4S binding protein [Candidatus Gastranaerophilales bacterium]